MTLSGLDVIARNPNFEDRAAACELRSWQWALLLSLDDRTELRDVAMARGVDLDLAIGFVGEALDAGLVHVVSMTLAEYRSANGHATPALHDDDVQELLSGYGRTVPEWMIAQHEEPEAASEPEHVEEPVAAYVEEPVAEYVEEPHLEDAAPVATEAEAPAYSRHQHDEYVAPAAPAAPAPTVDDHQSFSWSSHEDAVAEHHDDDAHAESHEEPIAEYDAAEPEYAAEPHYAAEPEYAAEPHYADHADGGVAHNGYAVASSWEPMQLVATVDEHEHEQDRDHLPEPLEGTDVPDGISIHLSAQGEAHDEVAGAIEQQPEHQQPEKGSISFSLGGDDPADVAYGESPGFYHAPAPARSATTVAPATPAASAAPRPPEAPALDEKGAGKSGDLMGNLLARALTFRIK